MIKLNGTKVEPTIFPDNTSQVWHLTNIRLANNEITWHYQSDLELLYVLQLADLINRDDTYLTIPYLPYARQDKDIHNDNSFALHTFAKALNTGKFGQVSFFDAHSDVAMKLIDRAVNVMPNFEFVKNYNLVCFPDAGARKRYSPYISPWNNQTFHAEKVRQQSTGLITHYELFSKYQVTDLSVIVVDDLCDGGATFNILADSLHKLGVGQLDLYVSHGLFSNGVNKLLESYDTIITSDSRFRDVDLNTAAFAKCKLERNTKCCQRRQSLDKGDDLMLHEINPMLALDFYKSDHRRQYPDNTELVYSNFTPRKSRVDGVDHMVFFGLQYAIHEYLIDRMNKFFFAKPKGEVVDEYIRRMDNALGKGAIEREHIEALHDLGFLPLKIKALPEGTRVPMGTPAFTMVNTHKDFAWVVNYFETLLSSLIWKPCTSATTAYEFKKLFIKYAKATGADESFVDFQGHDFSFRGMSGFEDACMSGAAHLTSFKGTDTVPAIDFLEMFYNADSDSEFIGGSVAATEHSVMCAGGMKNELDTIRRLLRLYPTGILSLVSDTWDFWKLVTEYLPVLHNEIRERWEKDPASKLVIRPDSGVPHKIINGNPEGEMLAERKGLIETLGSIFGITRNDHGFKRLHPCIGAIYGDGINSEEATRILDGLKTNGYESTSVVLGLGSYTYQYVTRDTYGTVCKATYCEIDGESYPIFKSPKTGAWKKSHKGLLRVNKDLTVSQDVSWKEEKQGLLKTVFIDGEHLGSDLQFNTLKDIRSRLEN